MVLDGCKTAPSLKTQLNMNDEMPVTLVEVSVVSFTALTLYLFGTTTSQRDFLLLYHLQRKCTQL
jgi:hypothetical protein